MICEWNCFECEETVNISMAALEMSLLKVYIEHFAVRMGQGKKKLTHVDAPPGGGVSFSNLVISTFNHLTLNFKEGSRSLRCTCYLLTWPAFTLGFLISFSL